MKKLLVGLDLKRPGYVWLMTRSADLADRLDGRVDLLYVSGRETEAQVAERRQQLEGLMRHVGEPHRGEVRTLPGMPAQVLDDQSTSYDALVVGPREPGALEGFFKGPMAIRIIVGARCPVFVPRVEQLAVPTPKMLFATDLRRGDPAPLLAEVGRWAANLGAVVDVAFCEKNPADSIDSVYARGKARAEWEAGRERDRDRLLALLSENVAEGARGEAILHTGSPGPSLVTLSAGYHIVAVGTGDIATANRLLGSVAAHVIRNARCDVLTIPAA